MVWISIGAGLILWIIKERIDRRKQEKMTDTVEPDRFSIEITDKDKAEEVRMLDEEVDILFQRHQLLKKEYDDNERALVNEENSVMRDEWTVRELRHKSLKLLTEMNRLEQRSQQVNRRITQIAMDEVTKYRDLKREEVMWRKAANVSQEELDWYERYMHEDLPYER